MRGPLRELNLRPFVFWQRVKLQFCFFWSPGTVAEWWDECTRTQQFPFLRFGVGPTPGAPFAQRAPSHGLDFSIALPMPALWWHFNINFRASCWFRLVYTIIIKYVHFFQHLLFRAEFCGRRHLGRHLEADVLGSNYHRRSTGEAALNGMCWPLTMSTVLRVATTALQLQHPIILQWHL